MTHKGFGLSLDVTFCGYEKRAVLTTKSASRSGIPLDCLSPQFKGCGLRPQSC